jgi:hypothetical protein
VAIDPLLGALGSDGAIATTVPAAGPAVLHWYKKGWVVSVYCCGGDATDQLTGRGLTVMGAAEKVPVAVN